MSAIDKIRRPHLFYSRYAGWVVHTDIIRGEPGCQISIALSAAGSTKEIAWNMLRAKVAEYRCELPEYRS